MEPIMGRMKKYLKALVRAHRDFFRQGETGKPTFSYPFSHGIAQRFLYYARMLSLVRSVEGDIVECGVGRGRSLLMFAYLMKDEGRGRKLWGFDSFEGFPEPTSEDVSMRGTKKGDKDIHTITSVLDFLRGGGLDEEFIRSQITLIKGFFNESLSKYRGEKIALLHLDGDLYESYKDPLRILYPRVVEGGVVLFDEYLNTTEHAKFPGAQKAIDEFFGEEVSAIKRDHATGKYYLIKK